MFSVSETHWYQQVAEVAVAPNKAVNVVNALLALVVVIGRRAKAAMDRAQPVETVGLDAAVPEIGKYILVALNHHPSCGYIATTYISCMAKALPVGTKRFNHSGYVEVKFGPTFRDWEFEHRIVWESANGPIPNGQFIHHLNGIKDDNRLENLALCANNADHHHRFHAEQRSKRGHILGRSGKGIPKSPEHRAKIAAANRGQTKTPEHRAKIAASLTGRKRPDISARMKGKVHSAETREKHRQDIFTRPRDPLTGRILKSS